MDPIPAIGILSIAFLIVVIAGYIKEEELDWKWALNWSIPFVFACTGAFFFDHLAQVISIGLASLIYLALLIRIVGPDINIRWPFVRW
jgi:hypothetical protein